jgi:IS605 OrfB family transposase
LRSPLAYALPTIKRVRIVRRADGYFCQFCIAVCRVVHHKPSGTQRGIDVGINAYYTDSAGTKVENPRYVKQAEERLSYWHREVSRKGIRYKKQKKPKTSKKQNTYPKGQPVVKVARVPEKHWHTPATTNQTIRRNQRRQRPHHPPPPPPPNQNIPPAEGKQSHHYQKAKKHLANTYLHLQRQREDYARKTACALVTSSDLIAYEDLQIRNMVKNHSLAKAISDVSWGRFLHWVRYYASQQGIPCIAVPPQFTSQDCSGILPDGSRCPERVHKSLSVRTHVCPRCGLVIDRDHNSGKLVLERGLLHLAISSSVPSGRRKQAHPA